MRTFIAIKIKPELLLQETVTALKEALAGEPVKWTGTGNLHLTLKFLGETSREQVEEIKKLLAGIAGEQNPFPLSIEGMGYFKSSNMPRVLYVKVHDEGQMAQLASGIENQLVPLGFENDLRPFNPHLTLARIKYLNHKKLFYDAVDKYRNLFFQKSFIKEIIFYQSILEPRGPVYSELAIIPLAVAASAQHFY